MTKHLDVDCQCGDVSLRVSVPGRSAGTRATCFCKDCQTAAHSLGCADDLLSPPGGSDIWQTTPDLIQITRGQDKLAILRLGPKGLLRWHATCCGTLMCNTLSRLGLPFVGVVISQRQTAQADATLGPVFCYANTQGAVPGRGAPAADEKFGAAGMALMRRMITAGLAGKASKSPFRDSTGAAFAPIRILTKEERNAARP